jgi:hypothetical protein
MGPVSKNSIWGIRRKMPKIEPFLRKNAQKLASFAKKRINAYHWHIE